MKRPAIIVDLDGTLYNNDKRRELYMNGKHKNFHKFHEAAKDDPPNIWCVELIKAMHAKGYRILFVSGRDDCWQQDTITWLQTHVFHELADGMLLMRKTGDSRKDSIIKEEIYRAHIEPDHDVLFAVDDRQQVVDMWRSIGIPCLQCDVGNF